jgi:hypothetical protein
MKEKRKEEICRRKMNKEGKECKKEESGKRIN